MRYDIMFVCVEYVKEKTKEKIRGCRKESK